MRALLILCAIVFIGMSDIYGQTTYGEIQAEKIFGGYKFTQNGRKLNIKQLAYIMESNPEAAKALKPARTNSTIASIVGGVGGFLIGWQLGAALGGGEPNWVAGGIGAGLVVVSIPISAKFNRQAKNAVDIYNSGLGESMYKPYRSEFLFGSTSNGMGLVLRF